MVSDRREVCLWVHNDALIIANDGKPVTRRGVLALCMSDLTEKTELQSDTPDDIPDVSDSGFLSAVRARAIEVYRADPNRLKRDARRERHVSADYGGRFLWELIQNADDAMSRPEAGTTSLIGTKGLGFKSILEVTDTPEVFSGAFRFHFSRRKSAELLQSHDIHGDFAPIFEIPHEAPPPAEVTELIEQGYATIIRLPYRDDEARRLVKAMIEALDHRFLLFSQNLQSVRIVRDDKDTLVQVTRRDINHSCERVSFTGSGAIEKHISWLRWHEVWDHGAKDKRLSVSICLPVNRKNDVQPLEEIDKTPLYVFFPTDEVLPVRAVVHVSFQLEQNRKHFVADDRNKEVTERLGMLLARILTEIPAEVSLKTFGIDEIQRPRSIAERLAKKVRETVLNTPFVPTISGPLVRPGEVAHWKGELASVLQSQSPDIAEYKLLDPSVRGCVDILRRLGAQPLEPQSVFQILRFCRNSTPEDCRSVVSVIARECLPSVFNYNGNVIADWVAEIPCWWTDRGFARALRGIPLLLNRPKNWPKFVAADALSEDMSAIVQAHTEELVSKSKDRMADRQHAELWQCIRKKFLHSDRDFLEHALLPTISTYSEQQWEKMGWDILQWVQSWCPRQPFDEIVPLPVLNWYESRAQTADKLRFRLAEGLRLPTDKGWFKPWHCYASSAWGAPREFDSYFGPVENRGVVRRFKSWRRRVGQREEWKSVLRFIGVSWEPKLIENSWPGHNGVDASYRKKYFNNVNRHVFDLKIEHFPECLGTNVKTADLVRIGQDLQSSAAKYPALYLESYQRSSRRLSGCANLAEHQLRESAWLPHKGAILFQEALVAPSDAYLSGYGITGLTPEIELSRSGPLHDAKAVAFLISLGVRKALPDESTSWFLWMERIASVFDDSKVSKSKLLLAAKALYREFLRRKFSPYTRPSNLRVPVYVGGETAEHIQFVKPTSAYWMDDPNFDVTSLRKQLLANAGPIFIHFLGHADTGSRLGIARLSEAISIVAVPGELDVDCTKAVIARYLARLHALKALVKEGQRAALVDDVAIRVVRGLHIKIATRSGHFVTDAPVRAFKEEDGEFLLVEADKRPWRGAGFGLARYVVRDPDYSDVFENVLAAEDTEEVLDRLRQRGIPEQELELVQNAMMLVGARGRDADHDMADAHDPAEQDVAIDNDVSQRGDDSSLEDEVGSRQFATKKSFASPFRSASEIDLSKGKFSEIDPAGARLNLSSRERIVEGSAPRKTVDQIARLRGKEAEDWLAERINSVFADWTIKRNERDELNRETDFVLRKGTSEFHLEVKRLSGLPGDILWSELEFRKAQALENRYFVGLALPVSDGYRVLWVWNPIKDFGPLTRTIEWTWTGTTRSTELPTNVWIPPESQEVPSFSRRYSFRITIGVELCSRLDQDDESLSMLLARTILPTRDKTASSNL